jgi:hypothetical protein
MKMQVTITVVGMKASKGSMDNGQAYDSTKAYCLVDLDARKGNAKGQAVAEYNIGLSDEYRKYEHLAFPFKATADMEIISSGNQTRVAVGNIVPVVSPAKS